MNAAPPFITAASLAHPGTRHAFFTRDGGVSGGVYASLNGGTGSRDDPENVRENRNGMAAALGVSSERFLVPFQVHSADAIVVRAPWQGERPRCDGIVTNTPGLALGVTGADCGMLLFSDAKARVIGAAHAGWKGALNGVLEATLLQMEKLSARRADIAVALGPMIGGKSYEVGPEFVARFIGADPDYTRFFTQSDRAGHAYFDLPAFIAMRAEEANVGRFEDLALDTYADESRFFSYRRMTHRGEVDYGRLISAIVID
ncbi:MAG: peptidoglycan editing factor PgeF [Methylobacteriaceae bacterium]|nr:peptidoglycan editing factor PgeF [Methylobacteriaceae bacterium]